MRVIGRVSLLLLALLSSTGCVPGLRISVTSGQPSDNPAYKVVPISAEVIAEQQAIVDEPPSDALEAADFSSPFDYRIGPGDVLQIVVWDHLELTNPFGGVTRDPVASGQLVAADGTVYFPYVGVFHVAGMTMQEARSHISNGIATVVNRPQVDVRVAAYRSARVQVTGEVSNPGLVTLDDTRKGVLEAINERGGLNPSASRRSVILTRGSSRYEVKIARLLSGRSPNAINPMLQPGDIIHIPDAGNDQVFVLGELNKQGPVVIGQQELTLTEALTRSGGLDRLTANDSGVLVFRRPTQPNPTTATVFALDLSKPEGLLLAGEFIMQPRDVIYVKATAFAQYNAVITQMLPTITAIYQLDRLTQ